MSDFHFLRPLGLLLLLLLPLIPLVMRHRGQGQSGWNRIIPAPLLTPLIGDADAITNKQRRPGILLAILILVSAISLAGPSWREAPTPLQQQNDSLVIVLDMSLSMLATDVEPDRLTQAKRKIRDILSQREGSFTGLVVYAADAHIVTPLTDDRKTIESLLGVIDPLMMPASGNRADLGVEQAKTLLEQGAPGAGRILLVSDGIRDDDPGRIRQTLKGTGYSLNTIAVGTEQGGPIPLPKRGFIRDQDKVVITKADPAPMKQLARSLGGDGTRITLDDADIRSLALRGADSDDWQKSDRELSVQRWQDDGYWLLWLVVPLALLAWRRGALLLVPLMLPLIPQPAQAMDWDDLWSRPDQRGEQLISADPAAAADKFSDSQWQGSALYRAGDFGTATNRFSQGKTAEADYNRGNALAREGKLEAAIQAYDDALASQPSHADATFNRDLVKKLLEQQKKQQQDDKDSKSQSDQKQNGKGDQQQDPSKSGQNQQGQKGQQNQDGNQQQDGSQSQSSSGQDQQDSDNPGSSKGKNQQDDSSQSEQQSQSQSAQGQQADGEQSDQQAQASGAEPLDTQPLSQSEEQWLRRIPDDPSGLMRRKFLMQYRERSNQQQAEGDTPW